MSTSELIYGFCRTVSSFGRSCMQNACQKRYAHHAPDYHYLKEGITKSAAREKITEGLSQMREFPQTMDRYFRVASMMKCKGLVSLVHAQDATYRAPRIFIETLSEKPKGFFRYIRQPSKEYHLKREDLIERIEEYIADHGENEWIPGQWNWGVNRLDSDPAFRPFLLSASYSMIDSTPMESASYFFFSNGSSRSREREKYIADQAIASSLQRRGLQKLLPEILDSLGVIFKEYAKLDIGTLYVIGIPKEKISRYAYDSKSFGIFSRHPIADVVEDLRQAPRAFSTDSGGLQARILLYQETLHPSSGIEIIDVNSPEEVEMYCSGMSFEPSEKVFKDFALFPDRETEKERRNAKKIEELDGRVKELAHSLC